VIARLKNAGEPGRAGKTAGVSKVIGEAAGQVTELVAQTEGPQSSRFAVLRCFILVGQKIFLIRHSSAFHTGF